MAKWRQVPDAPVRLVLGTWEFLSPLDAWEALHPFLTATQMGSFERVAVEVLGEDDPSLELPAEERYMASVKGKVWKFSSVLRRGIAEILALGATREQESCIGTGLHFAARAGSIVRQILPENCGWRRWASLQTVLPLLMEAAPDALLDRIELDIRSPNAQLVELLHQEVPGGVFGAAYHCGISRAMEIAAWQRERLQRVALCLSRLVKLDPGGQWGNRPLGSARGVFFPWRPQTMASANERIETLRYLCHREVEGTWKLLMDLLPKTRENISDSVKPTYRNWAAGWTGMASRRDYELFVSEVMGLITAAVEADAGRWPELIDQITDLPVAAFEKVVDALERSIEHIAGDELCVTIWAKLREIVQRHTYFHDADWALPPATIGRLAMIRDKLAPGDLAVASAYLFDDSGYMEGDRTLSHEQREERRDLQRRTAIRAIWTASGISMVLVMARKVRQPWAVGRSLAEELKAEAQPLVLPSLLVAGDQSIRELAAAFSRQRILAEGPEWAEAQPTSDWQPEETAVWASQMRFEVRTWDWIASKGGLVEHLYWDRTSVHGVAELDTDAIERAARHLIAAGRAWSSLDVLVMALHYKRPLVWSLVCDVLEAVVANPEEQNAHVMDAYDVQEALAFLQKCPQGDEARIARLEFAFLPLLDRESHSPVTLERQLSRDPEFFVDCLKSLYAPHHKGSEDKGKEGEVTDTDPGRAERARRIWQLLHNWRSIPGIGPDGIISAADLCAWVHASRQKALDADRLEVCDLTIGELFAQSAEDSDGAKPLVPIRDLIEECESDELGRGFCTGLMNSRGCHWKSLYEGGKQERDLAAEYSHYAETCSRWPRTAAVLRSVAEEYLDMANYEDERARTRD